MRATDKTLHVDIVSAEKQIFSGTAEFVSAPLETGEAGILPQHTPLLARLNPGVITLRTGTEEQTFYVSGGLIEIQPHVVTVLSDTALRAKDLDEAAAQRAKEKAEQALKDKSADIEVAKALAELAQSA